MRIALAALLTAGALLGASPAAHPTAVVAAGTAAVDEYWDSADGLSGPALRAEVHRIISTDVRRLSYSQLWDALAVTDRDPSDARRVVLLYQGTTMSASDHGGDPDQWNREHVWAQSHGDFGTSAGPGTDLHHVRPTDVSVNSSRGNLDFDDGGTAVAEAPGNFRDGDSWQVRVADQGDVARMILYMDVRYDGGDGYPDLRVDGRTGASGARHGRLATLLRWHEADPPSAFERRRNDVIETSYQGNRNPFVDHPEWVDSIW